MSARFFVRLRWSLLARIRPYRIHTLQLEVTLSDYWPAGNAVMVCGLVKAPLLVSRASLKDDLHSVIERRPQMSQHTGLTGGGGGEMNTNTGHTCMSALALVVYSLYTELDSRNSGRQTQ